LICADLSWSPDPTDDRDQDPDSPTLALALRDRTVSSCPELTASYVAGKKVATTKIVPIGSVA